MLFDDRQDGQRAHIHLSVLETLLFINQGTVGTLGRPGPTGAATVGWNIGRDLSLFGRKRVSEADPIVSGRGTGRHQRAGQLISAHTHRLGLSVLPGQELYLDLRVLLAPLPLPGRGLQSGPLRAGGVIVLVIGRVDIPEPTLARLLFSTGNF